jgi:CMP-N,N'-diacetyllegionaminic acid synthase
MNILCTICARKGSKGIKNKNMISINNQKLIDISINQAKKAKLFTKIVVTTDSKKIQNHSLLKKVYSWFLRPKELSNDKSSKLDVIRHALKESEKKFKIKFDIVCDLDVTSPLRHKLDIINSYKKFIKNDYEILFSVCEAKKNPYFNMVEKKNNKILLVKNLKEKVASRQKAPKVYEMNASIYFWKRDALIKRRSLFGKNVGTFLMPRERSIDIDDQFDLRIVRKLLNDEKKNYR